ncbi:MAG: SH3 domain-containing protein, partial [Anaerolineae bacterium]|nr:SH3 domain-containing protein [Anaerolineae bacterium]
MMRKFILIFSWLALLSLPVYAQDGQQPNAQVRAMSTVLNLRAAPASGAAIIAELTGETPLIAQGRTADNAWLKVRTLDSLEGWVAAGYIDLNVELSTLPILTADAPVITEATPAVTVAPEVLPAGDAFVKALALNLRAAPSTRGAILVQLPTKTPLKLLARTSTNTWLKVEALGQQGWVAAAYVQINLDLNSIPVETTTTTSTTTTVPGAPVSAGNVITNITSKARTINQKGQAR